MQGQERRSTSTKRVPVEAVVELCGIEAGSAPAFEAASVNVSGRGMQVRTAYLPEVNTPLVCRFEHGGQEVIVEGVVAWRRDETQGGEFGLRFTALDSGSVEVLRDMCGVESLRSEAADVAPPTEASPAITPAGSRVRLHIDGLGAPMRARVREGGRRRVHVGSNLEFLAVGKHLELENLEHDQRRSARIDSVEVVIDPQTQIPQLVVALHYDDAEEDTPQPSVVDTQHPPEARADIGAVGMDASRLASEADALPFPTEESSASTEADDDAETEAAAFSTFGSRLGHRAGDVAKQAGAVLQQLSGRTAAGLRHAIRDAGGRLQAYRAQRAGRAAPRRVTADPPQGPLSVEGGRLRPPGRSSIPLLRRQGAQRAEETPAGPGRRRLGKRGKRALAAGAGVALLGTVAVMAFGRSAPPPGAEPEALAPKAVSVAVAEAPAAVKVQKLPEPKPAGSGITADVPLFGATPLATMEPAPLGPAPEALAAASAAPAVADEAFPAPPAAAPADRPELTEDEERAEAREDLKPADPSSVKPWGRGRLHLPIVHRVRLDAPGAAIRGVIEPTGFSVVIPGRKVMESGASIAKRDKRIAKVRARNVGGGAQVTFQFRDGTPGYRVRLKRDFVEILVSSPTEQKTD